MEKSADDTVRGPWVRWWDAFGYRLAFEWDDPALESYVLDVVLPDWRELPEVHADVTFALTQDNGGICLWQDQTLLKEGLSFDALPFFLRRYVHLEVATRAPELVFVHAGVVMTGCGLLVLPGASFSGKSTLVKSLVDQGASYFSDEFAVVDCRGEIRSFPRALSLRLGRHRRVIPAGELGWTPTLRALPAAAVVDTRYTRGARWSPAPLSPGEAVMKLLENTVSARTEPRRAISYLSLLVKGARCVQSERGESDTTAPLLLEWLARGG